MATDEQLSKIAEGYDVAGETVRLGAAVSEGEPHPEVGVRLPMSMMNRHGLIAGATGTGKTKTLQLIAEQLSAAGVPVFLADVKGDLSGLAEPGAESEKLRARTEALGQQWEPASYPTEFFALGGEGTGVPIRATVHSFGPILLARVMDLNETQESSLQLIFRYADQHDLELFNLADLRAVIEFLTSPEGKESLGQLGGLSKQTAGVILRKIVGLEADGMEQFFGEPEFDTQEIIRTAEDGRGIISALELSGLQSKPQLFSTFLMWLLADLFEHLPEVGDVDKPKLVFFFDEAHLLFDGASKAFRESITQTVRLIRSKGVGIFFITQTPKDLPSDVLGQLANRVQHALRAFTPEDAKALKATVSTFPTSSYDLASLLTSIGIGEAIVTVMTETGAPSPVAWTRMFAPQSAMAPASAETLERAVRESELSPKYSETVDSYSAYEKLSEAHGADDDAAGDRADAEGKAARKEDSGKPAASGKSAASGKRADSDDDRERRKRNDAMMRVGTNVASQIGRELVRGLFGTSRRSGRGRRRGGFFG